MKLNVHYYTYSIFFYWIFSGLIKKISLQQLNDASLLIISYDAFQEEYLSRNVTPYLNKLRVEGVSVDYMRNVFPTKTFVNHHSIATGLYPGVHGVLANKLYDSLQGELSYSYELYHYNEDILPIWALNEKFGKHSGCMMWPGSNFLYKGFKCTYQQNFNISIPWKERIDTIMNWFTNSSNPANLVMLYLEEPDRHGHMYGPDSDEVTSIVQQIDSITKYVHESILKNNLTKDINVIHISDHGMEGISSPNFINLTDLLDFGTYKLYGTSPVLQIVPTEIGNESEIYNRLLDGALIQKTFKIYNASTLLDRWYCKNERRLNPILAVAEHNYAFQDMYDSAKFFEEAYNITFTPTRKYGVHGYDNAYTTMHAIFIANGPIFKTNHNVKPFDSIDLYNLFCIILNLEAAPNNGSISNILDILIDSRNANYPWIYTTVGMITITVVIIIAVMLLLTAAYLIYKRMKLVKRVLSLNKIYQSVEGEKLLDPDYECGD